MPIQMPNKAPKKPTNWSKISKQLSFWVFVILVPVAIIQFSGKGSDAAPEISYTPQYSEQLEKNNIAVRLHRIRLRLQAEMER